jgi:hypothetical protein
VTGTGNIWTPEMLVAFRELYSEEPELPFRRIAALMSIWFDITLTSNACIGKAHRLGLPMRGHRAGFRKPHQPHTKRPKMIKVRVDAPIAPVEAIIPDAPPPEGLTIYQLRENTCHWPLGETYARPPFQYCGEPSLLGRSYCVTHMSKATGGRT